MKVVHLLRKPCAEPTVAANVLRCGTGALNIDATRVGMSQSDADYITSRIGGFNNTRSIGGNGAYSGGGAIDRTTYDASKGRWPANLVLQHLPTCSVGQTGTRKERGYTVNRFTDGAKPFGGGAGHPYESERLPPSTVTAWACAPGCPVAGLDRQSGTTKAVMRKPTGKPIYSTEGTAMVWNSNSVTDTTERGFTDEGGASRFFKQVKP